jgi:hypothetical protein
MTTGRINQVTVLTSPHRSGAHTEYRPLRAFHRRVSYIESSVNNLRRDIARFHLVEVNPNGDVGSLPARFQATLIGVTF